DKLGGRTTLGLVFITAAAGIAALLGASHAVDVAGFILIFGLTAETPAAIFPMVVAESLGVRRFGAFLGLLALCRTLEFAFGPVIAGRIFDRSGTSPGPLFLFVALEVISMLVVRATLPLSEEKARVEAGQAGHAQPAATSF